MLSRYILLGLTPVSLRLAGVAKQFVIYSKCVLLELFLSCMGAVRCIIYSKSNWRFPCSHSYRCWVKLSNTGYSWYRKFGACIGTSLPKELVLERLESMAEHAPISEWLLWFECISFCLLITARNWMVIDRFHLILCIVVYFGSRVVHIVESVFVTFWLTIWDMILSKLPRTPPTKSFSTSCALSRFLAF
jgi:hypothetical protein